MQQVQGFGEFGIVNAQAQNAAQRLVFIGASETIEDLLAVFIEFSAMNGRQTHQGIGVHVGGQFCGLRHQGGAAKYENNAGNLQSSLL